MKLIINADDYGLTRGVSKGIIKALKEGILTDTTAMTNMPYFKEAIELAKENGINEMGIHLVLTCGKPLLNKEKVRTLVDDNGNFYRNPELMIDNADIFEIEEELREQINTFLQTGMRLNHIDFHHHAFAFRDDIFKVVMKLARELDVPIRCPFENTRKMVTNDIKYPESFSENFYGEKVSMDNLINILEENRNNKVLEIMSHPAIVDEELINKSSYCNERGKELEILLSDKMRNYIEENNIKLIKFSEL